MKKKQNARPPSVAMSVHCCPSGQYFSLKADKDFGKFLKVTETELLIVSVVILFSLSLN